MDNIKWNRCDECGRFIKLEDFIKGRAVRRWYLGYPGNELYITLCPKHKQLDKARW